MFGPSDLPGWTPPGPHPMIQRGGTESIFTHLLGGSIDEKIELARKASPVTWVTKDCAPLFIMHGTADPLVGLEQSQRLAGLLKAAGVEMTLDVVEGGGHGGGSFSPGIGRSGCWIFSTSTWRRGEPDLNLQEFFRPTREPACEQPPRSLSSPQ